MARLFIPSGRRNLGARDFLTPGDAGALAARRLSVLPAVSPPGAPPANPTRRGSRPPSGPRARQVDGSAASLW